MRAAPTERIAGLAFFAFVLIQVPFFIVESPLAASGLVLLSPLQVTAANIAKTWPESFQAVEYLLIPGGWMRESLSPFIRCQFKTGGKGCSQEKAKLFDLEYVRKGNNLALLVKLLETNGIAYQIPILYGCTMIVVSALFSLYYSVKTAVLGFALLAYGVVQGNHIPLPPGVLSAFLCVYAGFQLGELRGNMRAKKQQRTAAAAAGGAASSSSGSKQQGATVTKLAPGSASKSPAAKQKKQRKQA